MKRHPYLIASSVVILAITLPYLLAALLGGSEYTFTGFLLNPMDGASYLAKMHQGWSGEWRFVLPFTAEPGDGAYLFLFYLLLGHLSRWFGLPIVIMFHLARLAGACSLLYALYRFLEIVFADRPDLSITAYWWAAIGSGMGWLVLFVGAHTADFWVAEAYPFLSMYSNPHFSLGLALLLWIFILLISPEVRYRELLLCVLGLLISIILPFGVVVMLLIAGVWLVWTWVEDHRFDWLAVVFLGILGGPFLVYQYWAAITDPVLAVWNAQNLTPSPPLWDFLISFSPAFPLALLGCLSLSRQLQNRARRLILAWFVAGVVLVYLPFSLQRRFMLGLFIPTAVLAVYGLAYLRQRFAARMRHLQTGAFGLSLPTNILIIIIGLFGAISHSPVLYLNRAEVQAVDWIVNNTPASSLVLSAPDFGRVVAYSTGRRVVCCHPYETVDADEVESRVLAFYASDRVTPTDRLLASSGVDYLVYGPRERLLGDHLDLSAFSLVYDVGGLQIYSIQRTQ